MSGTEENRREDRWHVGKEIPVAVILAFFLQTVGAVWWAATLTAKIEELSYQVAALTVDKYTKGDADRDKALMFQRMQYIEERLTHIEIRRTK